MKKKTETWKNTQEANTGKIHNIEHPMRMRIFFTLKIYSKNAGKFKLKYSLLRLVTNKGFCRLKIQNKLEIKNYTKNRPFLVLDRSARRQFYRFPGFGFKFELFGSLLKCAVVHLCTRIEAQLPGFGGGVT